VPVQSKSLHLSIDDAPVGFTGKPAAPCHPNRYRAKVARAAQENERIPYYAVLKYFFQNFRPQWRANRQAIFEALNFIDKFFINR
jgi:ribosomal protein L39E